MFKNIDPIKFKTLYNHLSNYTNINQSDYTFQIIIPEEYLFYYYLNIDRYDDLDGNIVHFMFDIDGNLYQIINDEGIIWSK